MGTLSTLMPNTETISGGMRHGGPVNQPSRSGPIQGLRIIALLLFVPMLSVSRAAAQDVRVDHDQAAKKEWWRRWSFGAGLSFLSTSGSYANNAAIINTKMFGEDGIPFTGDMGEVTTCTGLEIGYYPEVDPFCDPRPDDLIAREGTIEEPLGYGITVAFDVTQRFQLAFDANYYRSEVGPIDVYATETYPFIFRDQVIELLDRDFKEPIPAGELTQIPLTLSGLVRLRPGKSIRPYFGAGAGVILSGFEQDDQVDDLQSRLETLRIRGYANEKGRNVTPFNNRSEFEFDGGLLRFRDDIEVEVDDAHEWHLSAGLEYLIDDRFSLVFNAKYLFADGEVSIEIMGEDQLDIYTWPDELYHPDGSLAVFSPTGGPPNTLCFFARSGYGCIDDPTPGKRVTPVEGTVVNNEPTGPFTCPGRADFDANGSRDYCYAEILKSDTGRDILGMWVIQGGEIEMSGYSFAIGLRVHL